MSEQGNTTVNQAVQQAVQATPAQAPLAPQTASAQSTDQPRATVVPVVQADTLPQGMAPGPDGRVQVLSTSAFKRLKDDARERGKKEAMQEFLSSMGYASPEELKAALDKVKNGAQAPVVDEPQVQAQGKNKDNGALKNLNKEHTRLQVELDRARKDLNKETGKKKELQQKLDALEAEILLRESAIRSGVVDVDYSLRLLSRQLEGKSEADIDAFDENKFFVDLKGTHPYLFREVARPATTGTGAGQAPAAPGPGQVAQTMAQNNKIDVRKMNNDDYRKYLAERGLNLNV